MIILEQIVRSGWLDFVFKSIPIKQSLLMEGKRQQDLAITIKKTLQGYSCMAFNRQNDWNLPDNFDLPQELRDSVEKERKELVQFKFIFEPDRDAKSPIQINYHTKSDDNFNNVSYNDKPTISGHFEREVAERERLERSENLRTKIPVFKRMTSSIETINNNETIASGITESTERELSNRERNRGKQDLAAIRRRQVQEELDHAGTPDIKRGDEEYVHDAYAAQDFNNRKQQQLSDKKQQFEIIEENRTISMLAIENMIKQIIGKWTGESTIDLRNKNKIVSSIKARQDRIFVERPDSALIFEGPIETANGVFKKRWTRFESKFMFTAAYDAIQKEQVEVIFNDYDLANAILQLDHEDMLNFHDLAVNLYEQFKFEEYSRAMKRLQDDKRSRELSDEGLSERQQRKLRKQEELEQAEQDKRNQFLKRNEKQLLDVGDKIAKRFNEVVTPELAYDLIDENNENVNFVAKVKKARSVKGTMSVVTVDDKRDGKRFVFKLYRDLDNGTIIMQPDFKDESIEAAFTTQKIKNAFEYVMQFAEIM